MDKIESYPKKNIYHVKVLKPWISFKWWWNNGSLCYCEPYLKVRAVLLIRITVDNTRNLLKIATCRKYVSDFNGYFCTMHTLRMFNLLLGENITSRVKKKDCHQSTIFANIKQFSCIGKCKPSFMVCIIKEYV